MRLKALTRLRRIRVYDATDNRNVQMDIRDRTKRLEEARASFWSVLPDTRTLMAYLGNTASIRAPYDVSRVAERITVSTLPDEVHHGRTKTG